MKIIILSAKGVNQIPFEMDKEPQTTLEWLSSAFNKNDFNDINIVGGKDIENLSLHNLEAKYIYNPKWNETGPIFSLFLVKDLLLSDDCIISYSDVVHRQEAITNLVEMSTDCSILVDSLWKSRYSGRTRLSLSRAEKVILHSNNFVQNVSIDESLVEESSAEFAGMIYISKKTTRDFFQKIGERFFDDKSHESIPYLLNKLIKFNVNIKSVDVNGDWAELDDIKSDGKKTSDFQRFVFGTKSQTLERLKPILKVGKILPQITFCLDEWRDNPKNILKRIKSYFRNNNVVVRSSTFLEDGLQQSYAGHFVSILNVNKEDSNNLMSAIEEVIDSYGSNADSKNQILVQPQIEDVTMSGVLFTCDIRTGAPYYTINYSTSGDTDIVTSGIEGDYNLLYVNKNHKALTSNIKLNKLIHSAIELENLTGNKLLDIEFAFDSKDLFIFQARPITSSFVLKNYEENKIDLELNKIELKISELLKPKSEVLGDTTILGDMPDWNPAELIGSKPRPLAHTIFDYLITKKVWRLARSDLGYFNPKSERLMQILGGHPYIDVRNSLNSFTPNKLKKKLREKLVNESLTYLRNNPTSHDKLEFEVATTCFSPLYEKMVPRWKAYGFNDLEISEILATYKEHTLNIITGNHIKKLINKVDTLNDSRELFKQKQISDFELISSLLKDCELNGTRPFASLARLAFIGNSFLRSFLSKKAITQESYDAFLNSISTVASDMSNKFDEVRRGNLTIQSYLEEYGHLRPGTWDIRSLTYSESPETYFNISKKINNRSSSNIGNSNFSFCDVEIKKMQNILDTLDFKIKINDLLSFIKDSISAREYAKFIFSRNVSEILQIITRIGLKHNISRSDLSYVDIGFFLDSDKMSSIDANHFEEIIKQNKDTFNLNQQIILPQLIFSEKHAHIVQNFKSRANYITVKKIIGEIAIIDGKRERESITDKIVLIESADPGYDWIFTHKIKGLITKYGGAASHMAIRSSEFDLPAAIGLGQDFDKIKQAAQIQLDCENKRVTVL